MPRKMLRNTAGQFAAVVDRAFAGTALNPPKVVRSRSSAESLGHEQRMQGLFGIQAFYGQAATDESRFFVAPDPITPIERRRRSYGGGEAVDLSWGSQFEPIWTTDGAMEAVSTQLAALGDSSAVEGLGDELRKRLDRRRSLRDKYLSVQGNRRMHVRWLRHGDGKRPCVVLIHGYLGGTYAVEERIWPVRTLFERGYDVVLSTLPFHALRRDRGRRMRAPNFPSSDPRFTVEGFRQMVFDHRALFDYLLDGRVRNLGLMGMSLGGYSSALLATVDPRVQYAVLHIPLASIGTFAHEHGRMVGAAHEQRDQAQALTQAQLSVSPLARTPKIAGDRVLIIAGENDRVTGMRHSRMLAEHFGAPLHKFGGGHLLQFGRGKALQPAWELMERVAGSAAP